jgi:hypothetical protein
VNRRPAELAAAVLAALPSLAEHEPTLRWVAPVETARFREPQDAAFLEALELGEHLEKLEAFGGRSLLTERGRDFRADADDRVSSEAGALSAERLIPLTSFGSANRTQGGWPCAP